MLKSGEYWELRINSGKAIDDHRNLCHLSTGGKSLWGVSERENGRKGRRDWVQTTLISFAAKRKWEIRVLLVREVGWDFFLKMWEVPTCLLMGLIHRGGKFDGEGEKEYLHFWNNILEFTREDRTWCTDRRTVFR